MAASDKVVDYTTIGVGRTTRDLIESVREEMMEERGDHVKQEDAIRFLVDFWNAAGLFMFRKHNEMGFDDVSDTIEELVKVHDQLPRDLKTSEELHKFFREIDEMDSFGIETGEDIKDAIEN